MRRLTVAMVAACPLPAPRGTPIRIQRLAEALGRRGLDVHVATYRLGREVADVAPNVHVHRTAGIARYRRLDPGPGYQKLLVMDVALAATLRRLLSRQHVDIVHAHHAEGLLAALSLPRRSRPPIVYDAHTLLGAELPFYGLGLPRGFKRLLGRGLDRWLPARADHVVAVTRQIGEHLRRAGIDPERVSVVPSGIEPDHFPRRNRARRSAGDPPLLCFAGNLAPHQRIDLLLPVFRAVSDAHPSARLRIVTEDSFESYHALAEGLGLAAQIDVVQAGFDALPAQLAGVDVALNPRAEGAGFPQKLLNYMAAGLPTVSFAGAAGPVRHLETGWVAADGDVEGFAVGTLRLIEDADLAGRLGAAARKQVREELSWDHSAELVHELYERLLRWPS